MGHADFSSAQQATPTGRGTGYNPHNRFHGERIIAVDDGWERDTPAARLTEVRHEHAKTVISRNRSPDVPFEQSINPYRGCEHGCIYCFVRPSHAYWDLSPGIDFETRLIAKVNLCEVLERELCAPSYRCSPIALGSNTDPYQPIERELKLTRGVLEIMLRYRHPVTIVTKGAMILRDLDLLAELTQLGLVKVFISMTTLDDELKRTLEPRAASGAARLRVIARLREAGIPVGVLCAPIIPMINDSEIDALLKASAEAGATSAGWVMLRLPHEVVELFEHWLAEHYLLRAKHVLNMIRDTRAGELYNADFSQRMRGTGQVAQIIKQRFDLARRRYGLVSNDRSTLRCDLFAPPGQQLGLF
ncbi:PA0069 family radical SAM protein [Carnimonas bestiolae]|uniref:PA0069 family radical SAM protein n=1 Tax=Carnimonas bestiolae TaxID=3402172 RepID=UPI003EDBBD82